MKPINELLGQTSRTFALSIPFLPAELQRSVTVAYLLFRIADTVEDEFRGSTQERALALGAIADRFAASSDVLSETIGDLLSDQPPIQDSGYATLLSNTRVVLDEYGRLDAAHQKIIAEHLSRTARGMARFLDRDLSEAGVDDLRGYCYIVAGIVGEMCSALFVAYQPELAAVRAPLKNSSAAFGEGLQLVNIIRDADDDLHAGRCYLPKCVDRNELIALAREDLETAAAYVETLERASAHPGIVAFNTFNAALAHQTLRAVEQDGVGAKVSRERVIELNEAIQNRVRTGTPLASLAVAEPIANAAHVRATPGPS
ncbi:MAG: squalene/phytoene synthase family protein [Phycisphaera sp.]|nr:MAG: squalene/phytoene synthase family protein [Phycisphaera sp.]